MAHRESLLRALARAPQHRKSDRRGVQAVPGRTRAAQGGGVNETTPRVVPAKAGTHNPQRSWLKTIVSTPRLNRKSSAYGPAFAGTTPEDDTQIQNALSPSPGISAGLGPGAAQRKRRACSAIATPLMPGFRRAT